MNKVNIHLIAAARPNFMKIAPLYHQLKEESWCTVKIVHTGQHYDSNMSAQFFSDLSLPKPDFNLEVGSGSHAQQSAGVMARYEELCLMNEPELVIVVGDVNSTMSCTLTAKKLGLPVAHLEAGLRSHDWTMPEEINRIVTDVLADYLWTPSLDADENLIKAGILSEKISCVGNIMIDSFEMLLPQIEKQNFYGEKGLKLKQYAVVTLHRPSNVDQKEKLSNLIQLLQQVAVKLPIIFPIHPRTRSNLERFEFIGDLKNDSNIHLTGPLSYVEFMNAVKDSKLVITDSGGIQEETSYLGIPCLTLRDSTERPITVIEGTNCLVNEGNLLASVDKVLNSTSIKKRPIALWDGKTASRVVKEIKKIFESRLNL